MNEVGNVDRYTVVVVLAALVVLFIAVWGFFRAFVMHRDFDKLEIRVKELETRQNRTDIAVTRLDTTLDNLDKTMGEILKFIRGFTQPSLALPNQPSFNHKPFSQSESK